jgi:hypothetical protein
VRGSHADGPPTEKANLAPEIVRSKATSPAGPDPHCVVTTTAPNKGTKGVPAKTGQVNRVTAIPAIVAATARTYGRTPVRVSDAG